MSKSTIEIKTAFEGCAEVCDMFVLNFSDSECAYADRCVKIGETLAKLSEHGNPLDDLFADSMVKLDGLGVEE